MRKYVRLQPVAFSSAKKEETVRSQAAMHLPTLLNLQDLCLNVLFILFPTILRNINTAFFNSLLSEDLKDPLFALCCHYYVAKFHSFISLNMLIQH